MSIPKLPKPVGAIPSKSVLAQNLQKHRLALGFTQEELSYHSGLHRTAVGHIEKARRNVTLETLDALAGALHVAPKELLEPIEVDTSEQTPVAHDAKQQQP